MIDQWIIETKRERSKVAAAVWQLYTKGHNRVQLQGIIDLTKFAYPALRLPNQRQRLTYLNQTLDSEFTGIVLKALAAEELRKTKLLLQRIELSGCYFIP